MANQKRSSNTTMSSLKLIIQTPHYAFPLLISFLIFLTYISLRIQFSNTNKSHVNSSRLNLRKSNGPNNTNKSIRIFSSGFPSSIAKDKRGWLLDPISVAMDAGLQGGAVNCGSIHAGEIRPGSLRGNHRHYMCNETFLIWGAKTILRLENTAVSGGYGESTIEADEVAVATSPHGSAHALINVDPVRSSFFIGCQDSVINYSNSTSDFNVWKDL